MISRPIIYPKAYSDFFRPLLNTAGSSWRRCGAQDHRLHRPCACGNLRGIEVPARICQVLMSSDFFNHDMNCCYGCYRQWSVEDGDGIQDRNDLSRIFRQVRFTTPPAPLPPAALPPVVVGGDDGGAGFGDGAGGGNGSRRWRLLWRWRWWWWWWRRRWLWWLW